GRRRRRPRPARLAAAAPGAPPGSHARGDHPRAAGHAAGGRGLRARAALRRRRGGLLPRRAAAGVGVRRRHAPLRRAARRSAAATLLFGVLHGGRGREMVLWTVSALLCGALLGALMLWRGNLCAPVVCHVLINAVQLRRLLADAPAAPSAAG